MRCRNNHSGNQNLSVAGRGSDGSQEKPISSSSQTEEPIQREKSDASHGTLGKPNGARHRGGWCGNDTGNGRAQCYEAVRCGMSFILIPPLTKKGKKFFSDWNRSELKPRIGMVDRKRKR